MIVYLDAVRPKNYYLNRETQLNRLYFFDQLDCEFTDDIEQYINSNHAIKIATLYNRFYTSNTDTDFFRNNIDRIVENSNHVFIIQTELHSSGIAQYLGPTVTGVLPGFFNNHLSTANQYTIFKSTWFGSQTDLYHAVPHPLTELTPYVEKPYLFDLLIGSPRSNRTYVLDRVHQAGLEDQFYIVKKENFEIEPGTQMPKRWYQGHGSMPVHYYDYPTQLGFIMPVSIYQNTAYSIVAETALGGVDYTFYTEKTMKPMIARRLFVAFCGQYHLANLHKLGFKTFDSIIDESYDAEPDQQKRFDMAWQQVERLCQLPQSQVLEQIKPIVEHNHRLIMNTDWEMPAIQQIIDRAKTVKTG